MNKHKNRLIIAAVVAMLATIVTVRNSTHATVALGKSTNLENHYIQASSEQR
jgi:hypothetical protein